MNVEQQWQAVLERDANYDQIFVYAVKTTGIVCRPTCPSRRPARKNVEFYDTVVAATQAGYRPCQRCHPDVDERVEPQLDLMIDICRYLEAAEDRIPTLDELGQHFAMSPTHLQRTFKRIVGVSPRQYADAFRQGRLKQFLRDSPTVTEAVYASGYGASSRVYEQTHDTLGMSPIHYRTGGNQMDIRYTVVPCRLGQLLVAATDVGICKISLGDDETRLAAGLEAEFPSATIVRDETGLQAWVAMLIEYIEQDRKVLDLPLDIQATAFQRKVWEFLRTIPYGDTRSYGEIARALGQPTASRAVATACASNQVAMVIPCHRVVRSNGELSGYRWGVERKQALLEHEREQAAYWLGK